MVVDVVLLFAMKVIDVLVAVIYIAFGKEVGANPWE